MVSIKTVSNPRVDYEERHCLICDQSFFVRNNKADRNQRCCSKACSSKAKHRNRYSAEDRRKVPAKHLAESVCQRCDKGFTYDTRDRAGKFCSMDCARAAGNDCRGIMRDDLAPTEHPTLKDIYWAAGIYEGEGCCHSHQKGFQVQVGQKDPWLPYRLRDLFGGSVTKRDMKGSPFYNWHVSGTRARGFIMTVLSLLSPRRQEQVSVQMAAW